MSRHWASKVDGNQASIVKALRAVGATVQSLAAVGDGVPDLLVGYRREVFLLEVKDPTQPKSARKLRDSQVEWHSRWRGPPIHVIETIDEALRVIGAGRYRRVDP